MAEQGGLPTVHEGRLLPGPVCFRLRSERLPSLADAITVAEVFRRRLLGSAAAHWGHHSIPTRLSGRDSSGSRLLADHHHAHFLVGSTSEREVTHLMVWAPGGFTGEERKIIETVKLPSLAGSVIRTSTTDEHPWLRPSRLWRSALPFLPVRHSKHRRGKLMDSVPEQVRLELQRRNLAQPDAIRLAGRDWGLVRTTRKARPGSAPALGAHDVEIEFPEPVEGPIALGANSHFSMGLFAPHDST